ncbi:MAG: (2Fe-2S)-binding protein [Dehalococcoidia bacterium]|nr:(2Fe-2S)-binding protein [Dehalococcoidia bacterium]
MTVASLAVNLTVDGIPVSVPAGASALDAINAAGVSISQLCKDADMPAIGACRTCLVQIDGIRGFPASCSTPASDGMVIRTNTEDARRIRSGVVQLTLGMVGGGPSRGDRSVAPTMPPRCTAYPRCAGNRAPARLLTPPIRFSTWRWTPASCVPAASMPASPATSSSAPSKSWAPQTPRGSPPRGTSRWRKASAPPADSALASAPPEPSA